MSGPNDKSRNTRKVARDDRIICVCDQTNCDKIDFVWPKTGGHTSLIESSKSGKRFLVSELEVLSEGLRPKPPKSVALVEIDVDVRYQEILGWGGSITDASIVNMQKLPEKLSDELLASYFGESGLQYNFARVPIAGCDFSTRPYSYDDHPDDFDLTHWQLAEEDLTMKIPSIKKARELAKQCNAELKLIASPWSAPAWMKTSGSLVRGHLIDEERVYRAYTNYLMKFYEAYEEHGIKFWGATVQNEPVVSYLPNYFFNSMQYKNSSMIKFISKYLGPALAERGMTKDRFKLIVGDDSIGLINLQVPALMREPEVQKYVSGLAFHWYLSGRLIPYSMISRVYNQVKEHVEFVIMSEACEGWSPKQKAIDLGSWPRAESYAHDIIQDLKRHTGCWIDWNLALDMNGGPNWSGNFVDSPILVDSEKGEFYKQPMYYALAQFSRFFRPGSIRVRAKIKQGGAGLSTIGALKEDSGHVIVSLLNKSNKPKQIELRIADFGRILSRRLSIEAKSINTLVVKL